MNVDNIKNVCDWKCEKKWICIAHLQDLMHRSERRWTINMRTLLHIQILACIMPCTLSKAFTHSPFTLHNKHAIIFIERLNFLLTMTHLYIYEHPHTLTLCFTKSHNKFANMLALSSTHTPWHLFNASYIHISHTHTCGHTCILHTQTHTNAFDHRIRVCNIKYNLQFCFTRVKEFTMNEETTNNCKHWFEESNKSVHQYHVMGFLTYKCVHTLTPHRNMFVKQQSSYISDGLKFNKIQSFIDWRWTLHVWEVGNSCSSIDKDITFKAWRPKEVNWTPRTCNHLKHLLSRNLNLWDEDQNAQILTCRRKWHMDAIPWLRENFNMSKILKL